jgi:hypothetical protein
MFQWAAFWIWWFGWRCAVTLTCMYTIQNVVHQEGYFISWETLFASTLCAIVGIRIWMPSCKKENEK